jgi:hypothetical protein
MESSGIPEPAKPKALRSRMSMDYAFERSCGLPPAAACRAVGGKVENGQATKWETNRGVQAWIAYYRKMGQTEEMLAAKRARIEEELQLVAMASMDEFVTLVPSGASILPVLDLTRIQTMSDGERRNAMAAVKTVRYTEHGPTFELHGKLEALNQLRDMNGFSAPKKLGLGNQQNGGPIEVMWKDIPAADQDRLLTAINTELASRGGDPPAG